MGSHIKGVKVGICCELGIDSGNRTSGSGRKGGKSIGGISTLDDLLAGSNEASGGKNSDSDDEMGSCEGATVYCRLDTTGGHQQ